MQSVCPLLGTGAAQSSLGPYLWQSDTSAYPGSCPLLPPVGDRTLAAGTSSSACWSRETEHCVLLLETAVLLTAHSIKSGANWVPTTAPAFLSDSFYFLHCPLPVQCWFAALTDTVFYLPEVTAQQSLHRHSAMVPLGMLSPPEASLLDLSERGQA
ncbi:hypothetical protein AOLI_G00005920 [Acnodon oligacanthus]